MVVGPAFQASENYFDLATQAYSLGYHIAGLRPLGWHLTCLIAWGGCITSLRPLGWHTHTTMTMVFGDDGRLGI